MDDLPLSSVHAHRRIIFSYPRFRWAMLQRRFCPQALSEERAAEFFGAVCQLVWGSQVSGQLPLRFLPDEHQSPARPDGSANFDGASM